MSDTPEQESGFFFFSETPAFSLKDTSPIKSSLNQILSDHQHHLGSINIIFCDDEYLLEMNREHLDHDYYTDIITFPMSSSPLSGDLFISVDRVKDNAQNRSILFNTELCRVMIHGVLHLVGYNDKTSEEEIEMRKMEDKYLQLI